jgi:DNA polymerase-4
VSRRLFACLRRTHERLEPFGLGAAYLDATGAAEPARAIAVRLRESVGEELGLPLRVGIASGKFVARVAAALAGEDGVREVPRGGERAFLAPLPATRLEGVGRKTAAALAELGARSIGEVAALGRERLEQAFGTHGLRIHAFASGADDGPVRAAAHPQSLSREATLREGGLDLAALAEQLQDLAGQLEEELRLQGLAAAKVTLKLRYADGAATTRSLTLGAPARGAAEIRAAAERLLERTQAGSRPVRGVGIQLARIAAEGERDRQLDLFESGG